MTASTDSKTRRTIPLLIGSRRVGCAHHQSAGRFREIVAVALFLTIVSTAYAKYSGGSGTALDPYEIATAADLIALGETAGDYDKRFVVTADIDLDPKLPGRKVFDKAVIAPDTDPGTVWDFEGPAFTGVFDGNGHRILHLTITGKDYLGLFGQLGSSAKVKDLGVVDVSITGSGIAGGLGSFNLGYVTNCYSMGVVSGGSSVGGLVGWNSGDVTRCYSTGVVDGNDFVGGLVGRTFDRVTQCYSTGAVNGTGMSIGGLAGENDREVTECYSTSSVKGTADIGGLMGRNGGRVTHCYSTGAVSASGEGVGGLVGCGWVWRSNRQDMESFFQINGTTTGCFWDTEASGQATSAGATGLTTAQMQDIRTYLDARWDFLAEIRNGLHEIWEMPQGGGYPVLAILNGYTPDQLQGTGTLDDPYLIFDALDLGAMIYYNPSAHYRLAAPIDLSGICWGTAVVPWFAGAFDGNNLTISNLTVKGNALLALFGRLEPEGKVKDLGVVDVNITGSDDYVGGLVAYNQGSVIQCFSTGAVSGDFGVGGLVGYNRQGSVTECYSTAAVRGNEEVGGLVGWNSGGTVAQCYSTGSVRGNSSVGGLVGYNSSSQVIECYSSGAVSGTADVGGLVGGNWGYVNSCFWDTQTSGQARSAVGTGKTTAEMQTAKTFLDAGWDFVGETANGTEDIWWILEGKDYPRLWWETAGK